MGKLEESSGFFLRQEPGRTRGQLQKRPENSSIVRIELHTSSSPRRKRSCFLPTHKSSWLKQVGQLLVRLVGGHTLTSLSVVMLGTIYK